MINSSVHEHSEKDFVFCLFLRKHVRSHIVTNERGIVTSRKMFITREVGTFRLKLKSVGSILGTPKVENVYFASQQAASSEHHHERYTHIPCWTCSGPLDNALVDKARKALCTLILRCRLFFSLRRRCRHVSNRASANETNMFYQSFVSALLRRTM